MGGDNHQNVRGTNRMLNLKVLVTVRPEDFNPTWSIYLILLEASNVPNSFGYMHHDAHIKCKVGNLNLPHL